MLATREWGLTDPYLTQSLWRLSQSRAGFLIRGFGGRMPTAIHISEFSAARASVDEDGPLADE